MVSSCIQNDPNMTLPIALRTARNNPDNLLDTIASLAYSVRIGSSENEQPASIVLHVVNTTVIRLLF